MSNFNFTPAQKSKLAELAILQAVEQGLDIGHLCAHIKHLRENGSILHVNEKSGVISHAYTNKVTALYSLFNSMDANISFADLVTRPFSVAVVEYEGDTYYRFSDSAERGSSCSLRQMIGDLDWIKPDSILVENAKGDFIEKGLLAISKARKATRSIIRDDFQFQP